MLPKERVALKAILEKYGRTAANMQHEKCITPLSLAIWYMDDGFRRKDSKGFYLCTSSYTQEEHKVLQEVLFKRFMILTKVHHQREYLRMFIPSASANTFNGLIKPYVLPDLNYKLL